MSDSTITVLVLMGIWFLFALGKTVTLVAKNDTARGVATKAFTKWLGG